MTYSGAYPTLPQQFLRSWPQLNVLNHTHITLDQRYFASTYPKPKQGIQTTKKEIILCLLALKAWRVAGTDCSSTLLVQSTCNTNKTNPKA